MDFELTNLDEFDRYESGQMAVSEKEAFRQRLLADQDLAAEHQLYLTLSGGIRTFHRKRLKALFAGFEKAQQPAATGTRFKNSSNGMWKWAVAASVAVLLAAGIFTWKLTQPTATWNEMFINDPGLPVLMSKTTGESGQYNQAMNFYRQGDFENAFSSLPG